MICMMLSELPNWPARLSEEAAAEYLSISKTSFRKRVADGQYPQPIRDGNRKYWSREQLDDFVAEQFRLKRASSRGDESWADLK